MGKVICAIFRGIIQGTVWEANSIAAAVGTGKFFIWVRQSRDGTGEVWWGAGPHATLLLLEKVSNARLGESD